MIKMVKKNKIKRGISNRLLYTLITIGILAVLGIGVYAVAPNPGHSSSELDLSGGVNGNAIFNGNVGIKQTNPSVALDVVGDGKFSGALNALGGLVWTSSNDGLGSGLDADKIDGKNNGELNAKYVNGSQIKVIPGSPNPRICVQGLGCTLNSAASCPSTGSWSGKTACTQDSQCDSFCANVLPNSNCDWSCNGNDYSQCSGGTQTLGSEACIAVTSRLCEQISGLGYCFCSFRGGSHTYAQEGLANNWYCANTAIE